MATNYTANYGLCQWEPEDNFLREEFNQDNAKIDAALRGVASTAEEHLAAISHDLYGLMLQNYYDGKTTGWKKALVFDGFQDKTLVAMAADCLFFMERAVGLCRTSQTVVGQGYSTQATGAVGWRQSGVVPVSCYGYVTGVRFKTLLETGGAQDVQVQYDMYQNDQVVCGGSVPTRFQTTPLENKLTFDEPIPIQPGDTLRFMLYTKDAAQKLYGVGSGSGTMGCYFDLEPVHGTSGTITTPALELPDRSSMWAWVRFKGGTVSLSAAGSGGEARPFAAQEDRVAANAAGEACTERVFRLDTPPASGPVTFTLGVDLGDGTQTELFDYGILLL